MLRPFGAKKMRVTLRGNEWHVILLCRSAIIWKHEFFFIFFFYFDFLIF